MRSDPQQCNPPLHAFLLVFKNRHMKLPVDKPNFYAYITGMLLPGIHFAPVIERVVNDAASVLGIAAILYSRIA
jgi:hypothetical protein